MPPSHPWQQAAIQAGFYLLCVKHHLGWNSKGKTWLRLCCSSGGVPDSSRLRATTFALAFTKRNVMLPSACTSTGLTAVWAKTPCCAAAVAARITIAYPHSSCRPIENECLAIAKVYCTRKKAWQPKWLPCF